MPSLSRRDFLKSAALAGAGIAAQGSLRGLAQQGIPPAPVVDHWDGSPLGRILFNVLTEYVEPSWRAKGTGVLYRWNDVIPVKAAVVGEGLYTSNNTWLQTETGYVYSSWIQPVNNIASNPVVPIGEGGAWGQITVPMTDARSGSSDDSPRRQTMYYSMTNRITAVEGNYYKMSEIYGYEYWVKAAHIRIISPDEVSPISPNVPAEAKRIEISIHDQWLFAYEADVQVFQARISTGRIEHPTPMGTWHVLDKRIGQRMTGGQGDNAYNLAGIPFVAYFNSTWAATHGCYWHNDYGRRHSNGCVNMLPEAAKWVFRWTTPYANYFDYHTSADPKNGQPGTEIKVRY